MKAHRTKTPQNQCVCSLFVFITQVAILVAGQTDTHGRFCLRYKNKRHSLKRQDDFLSVGVVFLYFLVVLAFDIS